MRRRASKQVSTPLQPRQNSTRISKALSLQCIPGVGPKNEALFKARGIQTIDELRMLHNLHKGDEVLTRTFMEVSTLPISASFSASVRQKYARHPQQFNWSRPWASQDAISIKNTAHIRSILSFLKDQHPQAMVEPNSRVTLSVEGNISAGKSTFLKILESQGSFEDLQVGLSSMATSSMHRHANACMSACNAPTSTFVKTWRARDAPWTCMWSPDARHEGCLI